MGDIDVRERLDRPRAGGPAFDLVASKLRRPPVRPGAVRRSVLIERLAQGDPHPIVSVVAPAGYGKTTLLSQWAECNGQAFAWVSLDKADNDPKILLTYVAEALDKVESLDERVFDALASPGRSVPGSLVPRLGSAFWSMTSPVVLVLDDVHVLSNQECRAALSVLAERVPHGSRLALAGRTQPPLRIARLRAEGKILEIGPADLSLTPEEASLLLHNADVPLGGNDLTELYQRTEGWAAGLYLAALYLKEGGSLPCAGVSSGGADPYADDYVESEFLTRISRRRWTVCLTRFCFGEVGVAGLDDRATSASSSGDGLPPRWVNRRARRPWAGPGSGRHVHQEPAPSPSGRPATAVRVAAMARQHGTGNGRASVSAPAIRHSSATACPLASYAGPRVLAEPSASPATSTSRSPQSPRPLAALPPRRLSRLGSGRPSGRAGRQRRTGER